jgi:hypothetical protein
MYKMEARQAYNSRVRWMGLASEVALVWSWNVYRMWALGSRGRSHVGGSFSVIICLVHVEELLGTSITSAPVSTLASVESPSVKSQSLGRSVPLEPLITHSTTRVLATFFGNSPTSTNLEPTKNTYLRRSLEAGRWEKEENEHGGGGKSGWRVIKPQGAWVWCV